MVRCRALGGCVAVALAASPVVHAAPERRVLKIGVGGLAVAGDLADVSRDTLGDALERGLSGADLELVPLRDADRDPLSRCPDGEQTCLAAVAREEGVDVLLLPSVTVEEEGRWFTLRLQAVDGATGRPGPRSEEPCEPCGLREVAEKLETQAAALGDRLENLTLTPATVVIETDPPGASISIDARVVGTSPVTAELDPGTHTLRAELVGYDPEQTRIEAVRGIEESWSPTLVATAPDPATRGDADVPRRPGRGLRIAGWTTLGVGIAAVATGIPFIVLHGQPYEPTCDQRDAAGLCPSRWRSLPQGAAFAAVGAALVVTAIPLLAVGYKKSRVTVSVDPTNPGVGWTGRF